MKITWYGHSAFKLTTVDGINIIIDPYQPGGLGGAIRYDQITDPADGVLISHDHADHNFTEGIRGPFKVIRKEGLYNIKSVMIKAIKTDHGLGMGDNLIFVVEADGVKVVHLGDIGHTLSTNTIAQLGKVDVLMIPVDGIYSVTLEDAGRIMEEVKAPLVFPMHFKTSKGGSTIACVDQFLKGKQHIRTINRSEIEVSRNDLPNVSEIVLLKYGR
jgi:L-ascorbate metabolism protein UlaG (beta-lactamase superfamily)